jgi:cytochrome oxidase Cu insertion factor (SCO1/SenC/PrrC family)
MSSFVYGGSQTKQAEDTGSSDSSAIGAGRSAILGVLAHQQPSIAQDAGARGSLHRLRWLFWGVALVVGVTAGVLIALLGQSRPTAAPPVLPAPSQAALHWAAGEKLAPDFQLADQTGKPVSIAAFRGRPVIVTFIDPLCRNLCPTEAKILQSVEARLPAAQRPAILAVSVNQWGNARRILLQDTSKWKLTRNWYWAVGMPRALKRVWAAYKIAVEDTPKTVTGVTVHEISHTEAAFVVDPRGYQRALYLYPFRAADVARTVRRLASA